ncbi:hypothetical protein CDIK_1841 [Cucumispora dikerogammari]|nr:hypothetical protein CDIK_1841 [Cucumispora dikerogammari]
MFFIFIATVIIVFKSIDTLINNEIKYMVKHDDVGKQKKGVEKEKFSAKHGTETKDNTLQTTPKAFQAPPVLSSEKSIPPPNLTTNELSGTKTLDDKTIVTLKELSGIINTDSLKEIHVGSNLTPENNTLNTTTLTSMNEKTKETNISQDIPTETPIEIPIDRKIDNLVKKKIPETDVTENPLSNKKYSVTQMKEKGNTSVLHKTFAETESPFLVNQDLSHKDTIKATQTNKESSTLIAQQEDLGKRSNEKTSSSKQTAPSLIKKVVINKTPSKEKPSSTKQTLSAPITETDNQIIPLEPVKDPDLLTKTPLKYPKTNPLKDKVSDNNSHKQGIQKLLKKNRFIENHLVLKHKKTKPYSPETNVHIKSRFKGSKKHLKEIGVKKMSREKSREVRKHRESKNVKLRQQKNRFLNEKHSKNV